MTNQRSRDPRAGGEDWRETLEERTRQQEVKRCRDGRLLVRALVILVVLAAAWLLVPSDNRALLQGLWTNPPALEPDAAPANPEQAMRQLLGAPQSDPVAGDSPAGPSDTKHDPSIDRGDLQLAIELIDFIQPHGSGTSGGSK